MKGLHLMSYITNSEILKKKKSATKPIKKHRKKKRIEIKGEVNKEVN